MGRKHNRCAAGGTAVLEVIATPDGHSARTRRRPYYPHWRALTLSLVYVVFGLHIIHWRMTGKTLAPLELNEVMYTLELGIITAGFLFMCFLVLGTLVFGRFFCSWACHIMVLQELCAWLLRKIGIRAKPIRSRLLLLIPPLTACYMFIWPQILRAWELRAVPTFHLATDREGWASFVTNNFWRNLPGPWVIALTFVVCGFLIVYVLGSRTFCTYVCPYGAVFGLGDRFAPGRIRVTDDCKQCGTCTAACTSGIRVHEEVNLHGTIVNPACLKCLDCVTVCPQRALHYGFGKPALLKSHRSGGRFAGRYDLTWMEELAAAAVFLIVLFAFRGLYSRVPFLLSLGMGVVFGFAVVLALRLFTRRQVRMSSVILKSGGTWRAAGGVYVVAVVAVAALVAHSAFVRYHEYNGLRQSIALESQADSPNAVERLTTAYRHLITADHWGLITNERVERAAANTAFRIERYDDSRRFAERFLARHPDDAAVRLTLARAFAQMNRPDDAESQFRRVLEQATADLPAARSHRAMALAGLGGLFLHQGAFAAAAGELTQAVQLESEWASVHADLGSALAELGRLDEAVDHLSTAVRLDPQLEGVAYNLGTLLLHMGRFESAAEHLQRAAELAPDDADAQNNLGLALLQLGRPAEAETYLVRATSLDSGHADAHFNLARAYAAQNDFTPAQRHLEEAARLDPRYAAWLEQP